ncbi:MAG TPA: hypothetical protein PLE99_10590 [Candidatus Thiothrix moscowensis]|uniref:hypothetical protein n=1 Tax=unclassified Thiothrix TaxID=2636184 RepID=UPI0025CC0DBC|nr:MULTISPECIES: hypothetical protein [unclassified Thiothrix]HRJ53206.1 hypothetical protein [Candidatus Thiothrix moscowensis]HRJ93224.1 hypothetical protein [Candidatus Thiothrix moscowensis]
MEEMIGMMVALSIAAERVVEITKGVIPALGMARTDPKQEKLRKAMLQLLAVGSGIGVTFLASPMLAESLPTHWNTTTGMVVIGLLASGGSGFWNAILSYLLQLKDIRTQTVQQLLDARSGTMAASSAATLATDVHVLRPVRSVQDVAA